MQVHLQQHSRKRNIPNNSSSDTSNSSSDASSTPTEDDSDSEGGRSGIPLIPIIRFPLLPTPLHELSRREPFSRTEALAQRSAYCIRAVDVVDVNRCRNFVPIQDRWDEMMQFCRNSFSGVFWKFFLKLHSFSQVVVDVALRSVREMYFFPPELKRKFPSCRRSMMQHLSCIKEFWRTVRHTYRIDFTKFDLPSGTRFLVFEFVDPIWAWLMTARRHHPADLHWKPARQVRADSPVYGGGIHYGERFKHAFSKLAHNVMWVTLHWDGTYGRGLDVTPIAIGVANSNNCDKSKESHIGYMPFTPDQRSPRFKDTAKCTRLKFYIRQECGAAILRVLESAATTGVLCRLKNVRGEETTRLLFPKLASMNFDQPEAQLFFGHQNKETCSHCRRRRGRNAFRRNAPQIGTTVHRLYDIATGAPSEFREEARKIEKMGVQFRAKMLRAQSLSQLACPDAWSG